MKNTKIEWNKIKKIVACLVFCALIFHIFCNATYLFRNATHNRIHIAGLSEEQVDLDMVYVGGSAAFTYWQPLRAWNDYGFTSYSYATDAIQAEAVEYYIREVEKVQSPDLYVIDVRPFQYWMETPDTEEIAGLRNGTDSMGMFSENRWKAIKRYLENRNLGEDPDPLSYYMDLTKYHNNVTNLASPVAWDLMDNKTESIYKGWEWIIEYKPLPENSPVSFQTEEKAALDERVVRILKDLLDYCKEEQLNVLFVVCPYQITKQEYSQFNTIRDIIAEYGYDYLNTNDDYQEIGIRFATDFYNKNHVNAYGAEKYTKYLAEYLIQNYDMPNHKGERGYEQWDEVYLEFAEDENECKQVLDYLIQVEGASS